MLCKRRNVPFDTKLSSPSFSINLNNNLVVYAKIIQPHSKYFHHTVNDRVVSRESICGCYCFNRSLIPISKNEIIYLLSGH